MARAYAREDKDERRRLILATAARLFVEGDGGLPSIARIAEAAGLAKGTVYLSFTTKGAIFAALQAQGWRGLRASVDRVAAGPARPRGAAVDAIVAGLVEHLRAHPELLRLDALGAGVIEPNMEPGEWAAFKAEELESLARSAEALDRALDLQPGKGARLLMRSYALLRGLWLSYPAAGAAGIALEGGAGDFLTELAEALHEYWRGALAD